MNRKIDDYDEADDPPPVRRGNLVDAWLPDKDLWLLLTGRPQAPSITPAEGYGISEHWITWAKLTILDGRSVPGWNQRDDKTGLGRSEALTLYLCRLIRICDAMLPEATPSRKTAMEWENLLLGAAHIAGLEIDLCRSDADSGSACDDVLRRACQSGLVQAEKADSRPSGADGGSGGWDVVYGLTLLGKRKADDCDAPPPYLWTRQEAETAAATCDWLRAIKFTFGNVPAAGAGADAVEPESRPARPDAAVSQTRARSDKAHSRGDWPVKRTQPEVARYLSERTRQYCQLAQACLDGRRGARKAFVSVFGQTAIARAINRGLDGVDRSRPCRNQDVDRTDACKDYIKPLLQKPPCPPQGWKASASAASAADDIVADILGSDEE
jgi:hypothetical protein